mgnify:CR=1 FL=1|jgi:preprotein translocase subunit SecE
MADNKNITSQAEENNKPEKKEKKPNFLVTGWKKLVKFCKDTVGELKKVVWTSKSEVWKSFQLVIATVVSVSVAIAVIDFVSSLVINAIAGLIG